MHIDILIDNDLNLKNILSRSPKLLPFISIEGDDTGLVNASELDANRFWYGHEGFALYLAPSIPGSLNSSWPLTGILSTHSKDPTLKIRPDAFRLVPVERAASRMELSHTYGKPFNKEWLLKLKGTATAQHDPDPTNFYVRGHTTQFIWERISTEEIQFSCEELPFFQEPDKVHDIMTTRFLHGILNTKSEKFTHFDGAIHIYNRDEYNTRLSLNLKDHYMNYQKAKIFRLDSQLGFAEVEIILSSFYRWNDLVPEYFYLRRVYFTTIFFRLKTKKEVSKWAIARPCLKKGVPGFELVFKTLV